MEFKIGDRVRLIERFRTVTGRPRIIECGTVADPKELYCDPSPNRIPVFFDNYDYEYVEAEGEGENFFFNEPSRGGLDYHSMLPEEIELIEPKSPDWEV